MPVYVPLDRILIGVGWKVLLFVSILMAFVSIAGGHWKPPPATSI